MDFYLSLVYVKIQNMARYKIGQISSLTGLTLRTIRYYEELGLLVSKRTSGGQRMYSDQDLVYLKRIVELKGLGFSLAEIEKIFRMKSQDESGNKRREELLKQYKAKLAECKSKMANLQSHMDELNWHIHQLEKAEDGFTSCPGALCAGCTYKDKCTFFKG